MSCGGFSVEKSILERIINKVPGNPIQSKKEKQGYVNLADKSISDLLELIERQNKVLNNKVFINKLPDKGEKLLNFKIQLEEELNKREKPNELTDLLSKLNINGKTAIDKLEWTGNCNPGQSRITGSYEAVSDGVIDCDEETDPFKIIANHSGAGFHKKINRVFPPEPSLIEPSDVEDIGNEKLSNKSESLNDQIRIRSKKDQEPIIEEPYVRNLCNKFDTLEDKVKDKEKFLPHKTIKRTVGEVLNKNEEKLKIPPKRDITAATPPPAVYNDTKLLPLDVSVKLQIQQAEKLKEIQIRHATERLKLISGKSAGVRELHNLRRTDQFRDPRKQYDSDTDGSSDEDDDECDKQSFHSCHDDYDDDDPAEKRGGITFYNLIDN